MQAVILLRRKEISQSSMQQENAVQCWMPQPQQRKQGRHTKKAI